MAEWTNNDYRHYAMRETKYNSSVCINKENLNNMMKSFDTIFDGITNFTSEIASIKLYPFPILPYTEDGDMLSTTRGVFAGVKCAKIDYSAYYISLGEYFVRPKFNNFLDYKGYTQIKVFLPFLSYVELDVNEIMGKYLQIRLNIDYYSGKGMYILGVTDNSISPDTYPGLGGDGDMRILAKYECEIGLDLPLGMSNVGQWRLQTGISALKVLGSAMTLGTMNNIVQTETTTSHTTAKRQVLTSTDKKRTLTSNIDDTSTTVIENPNYKKRAISSTINQSLDALNMSKIGGDGDRVSDAQLMWQISNSVHIVRYTPKVIDVNNEYIHLYGRPCGKTLPLNMVSGYTEISNLHLNSSDFGLATKEELDMIREELLNGVYLP